MFISRQCSEETTDSEILLKTRGLEIYGMSRLGVFKVFDDAVHFFQILLAPTQ
jgi:hypothetical protein